MRKEIIVAIIIGLLLGLVVAYGVRSAQTSLENRQLTTKKNQTTENQIPGDNQPTHTLFITAPEPNTVTDKNSITIIGTTSPNALLSIISEDDLITTTADEGGNFTGTLELTGGVNNISIDSYNDLGEIANTTFMVIYTTADLTATSSGKIQPN